MSVIGLVSAEEAERCIVHYSHTYQRLVAAEILQRTEPGRVYRLRDISLELPSLPLGPWFPKLLKCRAFQKVGHGKYLRIDIRSTTPKECPERGEEWVMENLCQIRSDSDLP